MQGDGDGYGLGAGHFVHTCRRNIELTVVSHNNQIYGLTTGQASPTSDHLMKTVSTPSGVIEQPVNTMGLAIAEGATFVARGFAGNIPQLTDLIGRAIAHRGTAVVDVFQPCVTWNKVNTLAWFRERVYDLAESGHDPSSRTAAFDLSLTTFHEMSCTPEECRVPIGVFYVAEGAPTYGDGLTHAREPGWRRATEPRSITGTLDAYR